MTSPYDVICQTTSSDINIGAGAMNVKQIDDQSADSAVTKTRWFDFYASIYKYYHVVSTRWHITIENRSTDPLWVHNMYISDVDPSSRATNMDMLMWKDCTSHYLPPVGHAITSGGYIEDNQNTDDDVMDEDDTNAATANYESANRIAAKGNNIMELKGSYTPGTYRREIRQDADVETWTAINANPAFPEKLFLRFRPDYEGVGGDLNNASNWNRPMAFKLFVRLEYLVEFKELVEELHWPIGYQPATISAVAVNTQATQVLDEENEA